MAGPLLSLKYLQCMFSFFGYAGSSLLQGLFSSYGEPSYSMGFSDSSVGKESPAGQETWVGKILWRRKWQPTPVFLPGKSHGQKRLAGCSPWVCLQCTGFFSLWCHPLAHGL